MAINDKAGADTIAQSMQQILNQSFDQANQLLVLEPVGFDGKGFQRENASNLSLRIERDGAGNPIYLGLSSPGTTTDEDKWQIRKLTFDAANNVTAIKYSDGNPNFDNVWDDRASLTYV